MASMTLTIGVKVALDEDGIQEFGQMLAVLTEHGYGEMVEDFKTQLREKLEAKLNQASVKRELAD